MALSNKFGWLVLSTGNKSEVSTGYCTLYGDMAGGFALSKDVMKTTVYRSGGILRSCSGQRLNLPQERDDRETAFGGDCVRTSWIRIRFRLTTCLIRSRKRTWRKTEASLKCVEMGFDENWYAG